MKQIPKILIGVLTTLSYLVVMQSCEKQSGSSSTSKSPVITVTTSVALDVTPTSATSGGFVSLSGEYEVTERGITWSIYENPTTGFAKTINGSGPGSFTSDINDLLENTVYYVRAYAVANGEITYGKQISFKTPYASPIPGEVIPGPDFPGVARSYATSFLVGDRIYFGLGSYPPGRDFWEYDKTTIRWTRKADYPGEGLTSAIGFSIGTKGYVGTGYIETDENIFNSNEFWEYDTETDTWTEKASLPASARGSAVGFAIGNKGYIGSGNHTEGIGGLALFDFWEWDQVKNVWTRKADYPGSVIPSAGFSVGTKGYMGNSEFGEFWEWDQATNKWEKITAFPASNGKE